jgi:protein-disulfide isomerase
MDTKKVKGGYNMEQKSETITIRKDTLWKYSTFILLAVVILGVIFYVLPGKSTTGNVIQQPSAQLPAATQKIEVDMGNAAFEGNADAPVTVLEFSDFQCPYCQRHHQQSQSTIDSYINSGDVRFGYRHYPLPFHQNAQKAAEAAECARDQGGDEAFFAMHDMLFSKGSGDGTGLDVASLKQYAKDLKLDSTKFNKCLDSGQFADEVTADMSYGSQIGVAGTPAFFVGNDEQGYGLISGACPASTFQYAIDATLEGKEWGIANCQPTA